MTTPIPAIINIKDPEEAFRRQHNYNKNISLAKFNTTGSVTLTINVTTTTVTVPPGIIGVSSTVLFVPRTANAIAEWGNKTWYLSTVSAANSNFIITHANNAQADRTYDYFIVG